MDDSAEGYEGRERGGQLVVAGGHAAMSFKGRKKVFHAVTLSIIAAMERSTCFAGRIGGQTRKDPLFKEQVAQFVRVVALVGDDGAALLKAKISNQLGSHDNIGNGATA